MKRRHPLPTGIPGELYIGGRQKLREAISNQPELTAQKFVDDPFQEIPGALVPNRRSLSTTGRWERAIPWSGSITRSNCVDIASSWEKSKTALKGHSQVRDAAVLASEDQSGEKRLVAYVVPRDSAVGGTAWRTELRQHLQKSLPEYMVPVVFIELLSLPLTPNGKVDRQALSCSSVAESQSEGRCGRSDADGEGTVRDFV